VVDGKLQFKHAPAATRKLPQVSNNTIVFKRRDMSRHDLVSAQNHAEDMVAPLTANACITVMRLLALNATRHSLSLNHQVRDTMSFVNTCIWL